MEATVSGNQISVSEKEKYLEEMKGQGNEAEIQKAEAELKEAKDRLAASQSNYENYKANPKQQPDFTGEDIVYVQKKSTGKFIRPTAR